MNFTGGRDLDEEATGISINRIDTHRFRLPTFGTEQFQLMQPDGYERAKENSDHYLEEARNFGPSRKTDEYRDTEKASPYGRFKLDDIETLGKLRRALKDAIAQIGRKIISGDFNLASVTFPIWCMEPKSVLQIAANTF